MKYLITGRHAFHDGHTPFHYGRDEIQIGSTKSYSGSWIHYFRDEVHLRSGLTTDFFNFFFLHTLRHDFVPYVMTFFCTLRHEIMTGVMILLQALHDGGYEFAPSGMIFGHAVTSLNKQKRGSACKKARYSILVSLLFTPNTLQLPHSCGASGCGLWPSHMHGWPACPCVQSWIHVHRSLQTILSIALLLLRPWPALQ